MIPKSDNHSNSNGPLTGCPPGLDNTTINVCTNVVDCSRPNGEDCACNVERENKTSNGTQTCDRTGTCDRT